MPSQFLILRRIPAGNVARRSVIEPGAAYECPIATFIVDGMDTASGARAGIRESILEAVGETPLVRLSRLGKDLIPTLVAKLEAFNPGGSIKDRVALALIEAAERDGRLKPGATIVEPTSGNTGTGLAIVASLKGYRVIAVMPDKMSKEKADLLRAYGAEVVVAPTEVPPDSPESYYRVADRLTAEIPGAFQPNQYSNPANPEAHYLTTGPELWRQSGGQITHLVAGVGTGGTITGVGRYLREQNPDVVIVGADPVGSIYSGGEDAVKPYLVEGVGEDFWPDTYDPSIVDRYVTVSDKDAFVWTRRLAESEGILAGGSGGLALYAAYQVACELDDPSAMVAVILPDGGRSYLSKIYNDAWMRQYGFLEREEAITVGDVLRRKHDEDEIPPLLTVETHGKVRDAVALLHEHRVSQLPVVSGQDPHTIVGSVSERGLLRHAMDDPALLAAEIVDVMEPPFPAVSASDGVREAVELLADRREAVLVNMDGRAAGILTRADLLESLAR
jgi:cystathionine beta-synthase